MLSFKCKLRMSAKPSCALQPHCLFHKVNFPPLHSSVPVVFSKFFLVIQQSLRPARSKPTNVYSLAGEEKADFIPELRSGWQLVKDQQCSSVMLHEQKQNLTTAFCPRIEAVQIPMQKCVFIITRFVIPVVFSKINWDCVYTCLTQL